MRSKLLIFTAIITSLPLFYWASGLFLLLLAYFNKSYLLPVFGNDYFDDHNIVFVSLFSLLAIVLSVTGLIKNKGDKTKFIIFFLFSLLIPIIVGFSLNSICNTHFYCGSMYD